MDKLTAIKIKYNDGTYSDEIPVSVLSENVEWDSTHTLVDILGSIDVGVTGTIQDQISQLFNEKVSATQLQNYIASQLNEDVSTWLNTNVNPVGSAVVVDSSLTISGAAADAKETGELKNALIKIETFNVPSLRKGEIIDFPDIVRKYTSGQWVYIDQQIVNERASQGEYILHIDNINSSDVVNALVISDANNKTVIVIGDSGTYAFAVDSNTALPLKLRFQISRGENVNPGTYYVKGISVIFGGLEYNSFGEAFARINENLGVLSEGLNSANNVINDSKSMISLMTPAKLFEETVFVEKTWTKKIANNKANFIKDIVYRINASGDVDNAHRMVLVLDSNGTEIQRYNKNQDGFKEFSFTEDKIGCSFDVRSSVANVNVTFSIETVGGTLKNKVDDVVAGSIVIGDIYAVVGDTVQVFWNSIVDGKSDDVAIMFKCNKGKNYPRYWEFTPGASDTGTFPIEISTHTNSGTLIDTKTVSLIVSSAANPASDKNILCIGDSTMRLGQIPIEASRRLKGTTGNTDSPTSLSLTRYYLSGRVQNDDGNVGWEGTGGWTFSSYLKQGENAVRFTVTDANNLNFRDKYTLSGYICRIEEINVVSGAGNIRCVIENYASAFDSLPQSGTLTKSSGTGQSSITYTAFNVEKFNPFWNQTTNRFDLITYVNNYCSGHIEAVCILLGIDSVLSYAFINNTQINSIINFAKTLIRNIHTEYPNCKVLLSTLPCPSPSGGIAANYNASSTHGKYTYQEFKHSVMRYNNALYALEDDSEFSTYLYIISSHAQFDQEHGYPTANKAINTRVTATEELQTNGVHPNDSGYWQLSDALVFRPIINLIK